MAELKGTFYGVSVGPGDPELLTLQAVRLIRKCPVLAAPQTSSGQMLALDIARSALGKALDGKTIVPLHFAMSRDPAVLAASHKEAVQAVRPYLDAGQDTAMLNLGDVSIYATFGYLQEILQAQGYATAMAAGVPSFCAAAARLNQPLTGGMDAPLTIAPGSRADEVLDAPGTKVLMKTGRQLPALLDTLAAHRDGCVGMAANMIGVNKRIIAFENDGKHEVMFNPVIVKQSGAYEAEEGCLSLTGRRKVRRFRAIKVQWQNEKFQLRLKTFTGWTAEIIQHELDHCDGILI